MMAGDTVTMADRQERLERAIGDYLEAADAGRAPDPGQWLVRYPDLEPELGQFLADQAHLDRLVGPLRPAVAGDEGDTTRSLNGSADPAETQGSSPDRTWPAGETTELPPGPEPPDGPGPPPGGGDADGSELPRGARVRYFGDYELRSVLGRGGMGVVYRARQLSLNRPVALKMIKAGALADDDELRRFQNEAEAVAALDHPGIVPIHEVGEHQGQRYFSMSLVEGGSLAAALDRYRADPHAAARLVAEVARAVHHAHMRGILHRDLKPANILVDAEGRPHVTDFGLARRIGGDVGATESGAVVGTPGYMAPEQAEGRRRGITTATDVYGLGAVLYACLTGQAPFEGDSVLEVLDGVRHRPPRRPAAFNLRVPRDLEVICLKCLEKDPSRRYDSAAAVADDLERYLRGEPILARPVGALARTWMWCRRKPGLASLIAALLVAVAGGFAGVTWQWREAVHQRKLLTNEQAKTAAERDQKEDQRRAAEAARGEAQAQAAKAEAINSFLIKDLLQQADPGNNPVTSKVTVLEVLDRAAAKVQTRFQQQPEIEGTLHYVIAYTYAELGERAKSELHYRKAFEVRSRILGPEHPETLRVVNRLAEAIWIRGQPRESERLARQNLETCRRVLGREHPVTLEAVVWLAHVLVFTREMLDEAEPLYKENLDTMRRVLGEGDDTYTGALRGYASLLESRGKRAEAESVQRQRLEIYRRVHGPEHPYTLATLKDLAWMLEAREAESIWRQLVSANRRVLGPYHMETRVALDNLLDVLRAQGRMVEVEGVYRDAIEYQRKNNDRENLPESLRGLAEVLLALSRGREAETLLREAESLLREEVALRRSGAPGHEADRRDLLAYKLLGVAKALSSIHRDREARSLLREAVALMREELAVRRREVPRDEFIVHRLLAGLGTMLCQLDTPQEAEPILREAVASARICYPQAPWIVWYRESRLGGCLTALKRHAEAEALLLSVFKNTMAGRPAQPELLRETLDRLITLYEAWGKPEQAAEWRRKLMDHDFPTDPFAR
jgi:tetratricopeptide (TPR) repeat protein